MTKINQLIKEWPKSAVMTLGYLKKKALSTEIEQSFSPINITPKLNRESQNIEGLVIECSGARIKVEPNLIIWGSVYPAEEMKLMPQL